MPQFLGLGKEGESAPTYCEDVGRWATPSGLPRRLRKPWPLLITLFTPVLQERKLGHKVLVTCSRLHSHKLQSPGLANPHPQFILENSTVKPSQGFSSPSRPILPLPPPGSPTPTSGSLYFRSHLRAEACCSLGPHCGQSLGLPSSSPCSLPSWLAGQCQLL